MSATTLQPIETKTVNPPTGKDNDNKVMENLFSGQLEAMAKKMASGGVTGSVFHRSYMQTPF